jgi:hypothetical protein
MYKSAIAFCTCITFQAHSLTTLGLKNPGQVNSTIRKGAETDLAKSSGRFYFIVEIDDQESCLRQQQRG